MKTLRLVAPGTVLREGLDHITRGHTGGLIVVGDTSDVMRLIDGGFTVNAELLPSYLYELAKMDGAIILSSDCRRILHANVQLVPDSSIPSAETGIRHRIAERFARQTGVLVIAISQRRSLITLYHGTRKYVMRDVGFILTKANQAVQTLARYRTALDRSMANLSALEFEDLVTVLDVVSVLDRIGHVLEIEAEIHQYIAELGAEGRLVMMQLEELTSDIDTECTLMIKDYRAPDAELEAVRRTVVTAGRDGLSDMVEIAQSLGYGSSLSVLDQSATPRGYRILRKIPRLPMPVIENLIREFECLPNVLKASIEELDRVEGIGEVRARSIREGLRRLRDQAMVDRHL